MAIDLDKCIGCGGGNSGPGFGAAGMYCEPCVDAEEYEDDQSLRCPFCLSIETQDLFEIVQYDDGVWERSCPTCGKEYEVETEISYSFKCPAKGKKEIDN